MKNISSEKNYGIFSTPANKSLIGKLKENNANLIEFSCGNFAKREFEKNEIEIVERLDEFDWVVFTDIFSVDFFIEELELRGIELFEMDNLRVCSYGEAVADRLRFVQLHSDIIAQKIDENRIAEAIFQYIGDLKKTKNLKILIVKTKESETSITNIFRNNKINTAELLTADFIPTIGAENVKKMALLKGGAVDDFIFGSAEDVARFKFQFPKLLDDRKFFDIVWGTDEITLKTLDENGIKAFYFQK